MDPIKLAAPDIADVLVTAKTDADKLAKLKGSAHEQKVNDAAKQFEALMVQEMLKSMWSTVPKGQLLSGSNEEDTYRDMLNQAVADSVSEGRGIGIKEVIQKDIDKLEKAKNEDKSNP